MSLLIQSVVSAVQDLEEDIEGYVIRFADGHMIKIKLANYVRIHRAKDSILQEKRVIEMILNEKCDDVLPHLIVADRKALEEFQMAFWRGMMKARNYIYGGLHNWLRAYGRDRKKFAQDCQMVSAEKSVCFSLWDENMYSADGLPDPVVARDKILEELRGRVAKKLGSQTSVDSVRWMWGDAKWNDYLRGQDE